MADLMITVLSAIGARNQYACYVIVRDNGVVMRCRWCTSKPSRVRFLVAFFNSDLASSTPLQPTHPLPNVEAATPP